MRPATIFPLPNLLQLFSFVLSARDIVTAEASTGRFRAFSDNLSDNIDVVAYLGPRNQHQDAFFTEAVQILDSLKYSPSCNRMAATRLVTSCQNLDAETEGTGAEAYETLDRIRSVYAARLALCELDGASAPIPSQCLPVTISATPPKKGLFSFTAKSRSPETSADSVSKELLEPCLKALESRPQWWTSYSNSHQNAMVICQAARMETEKEELLNLYRSIVNSSLRLNTGLQEAVRNAEAEASRHQAFVQAVEALHNKLVQDLDKTESLFKRTFANLLHEIESGLRTVTSSVTSAFNRVQNEAADIEKDLRNASHQVDSLQQALKTVHDETVARSHQAILVHEQNTLTHRDLALSVRLSLESLVERDMARLYQSMESFDKSLEWLIGRMHLMLEHENQMSERLRIMETSMEKFELKASELHKAQILQTEAMVAQSQAQETMQFSAQVSQALLEKAAIAAANLQAMIHESAIRYQENRYFPPIFVRYFPWTACAALFIILGAQSPKAAICLMLVILGHSAATTLFQFL